MSERRYEEPGAGSATIISPADFAGYATVVVLAMGTMGLLAAIARRIAGPYGRGRVARDALRQFGGGEGGAHAIEELRDEVDQLRAEVSDLRARSAELDDIQNRLDFAERMLAQVREKNALPSPRNG
ncbi:MAG: hypothetical protein ACHQX4_06670 [Gemmatimonadales bacterium]